MLPFSARAPDDEMAPGIVDGDLLLILPLEPQVGDVVAIVDPLDPDRWTLRRVEAIGGAIRFEDGVFRSSAGPERVSEMVRGESWVTLQEGDHLVRISRRPARWELPETGVPDTDVFLGADARDEAIDSRWWGPMPLDAVQGVVALRFGPATPWRPWVTTGP